MAYFPGVNGVQIGLGQNGDALVQYGHMKKRMHVRQFNGRFDLKATAFEIAVDILAGQVLLLQQKKRMPRQIFNVSAQRIGSRN